MSYIEIDEMDHWTCTEIDESKFRHDLFIRLEDVEKIVKSHLERHLAEYKKHNETQAELNRALERSNERYITIQSQNADIAELNDTVQSLRESLVSLGDRIEDMKRKEKVAHVN